MRRQNLSAAVVLGAVVVAGGGFMWWASTVTPSGPVSSPAQVSTSHTSTPVTGTESADPAPELTSTVQIIAPATVLTTDKPVTAAEAGSAEDVAGRFAAAYLTRDRDHETWAENWASAAGQLAGPDLQRQLTDEWAQQSSRVAGSAATAQVAGVEPLAGATATDTEQSLIVTAAQTETVTGIDNPLTSTVVLHLRLTATGNGWIVDAILPQAN